MKMEKIPLNSTYNFDINSNSNSNSNSNEWNIFHLSKIDRFLLKSCLIVGSGGIIFGYDIGIISGTLNQLGKY